VVWYYCVCVCAGRSIKASQTNWLLLGIESSTSQTPFVWGDQPHEGRQVPAAGIQSFLFIMSPDSFLGFLMHLSSVPVQSHPPLATRILRIEINGFFGLIWDLIWKENFDRENTCLLKRYSNFFFFNLELRMHCLSHIVLKSYFIIRCSYYQKGKH